MNIYTECLIDFIFFLKSSAFSFFLPQLFIHSLKAFKLLRKIPFCLTYFCTVITHSNSKKKAWFQKVYFFQVTLRLPWIFCVWNSIYWSLHKWIIESVWTFWKLKNADVDVYASETYPAFLYSYHLYIAIYIFWYCTIQVTGGNDLSQWI